MGMNFRKKPKNIIVDQNEEGHNPWKAYTCKELIRLFMNGTKEAFTGLYIRYINLINMVCTNIVKNRATGEELAGDTYCQAMERIGQLNTYRDDFSFKKWIVKMAFFASINYLRHKKVEAATFKSHLIQEALNSEEINSYQDNLIRTENSYIISDALASLRTLTRQCIEGYYWHDLTYEDLMKIYGLSKDRVAYHMKSGRRHLEKKLKKWFVSNEDL